MIAPQPQWLRDMIASPPPAGAGVHKWLFTVSRQLHAHMPSIEIVQLLETQTQKVGRNVPRREIISAVKDAMDCAWGPRPQSPGERIGGRWPAVDEKLQREIIRKVGYGLADLWELSPIRIQREESHTEQIVDQLFPGNPLLCCGYTNENFDTRPRERWRGMLGGMGLIVPSPMSAIEGVTQDGRPSRHTLSNTGPRRYLICEFDKGTTPDEQAAILFHLAETAPLVCALWSGGKSIHGWFYVEGEPDDKVLRFFRYAATLGADPSTWTRSQFVRLPDGTRRENKERQAVYFLNFESLKAR